MQKWKVGHSSIAELGRNDEGHGEGKIIVATRSFSGTTERVNDEEISNIGLRASIGLLNSDRKGIGKQRIGLNRIGRLC